MPVSPSPAYAGQRRPATTSPSGPVPGRAQPRALVVEQGWSRGALAAVRALSAAGWRVGVAAPQPRGPASDRDAADMMLVERAARALLVAEGVDLDALSVPEEYDEPPTWTLAFVAESGGHVVGMAGLTELTHQLICLDQVSVRPKFAGRGLGTMLLTEVAARARELGYTAITGTTFRRIAFNAPFYARLGWVEDAQPHPVMMRRRQVEQALGLDRFGPRLIMRLPL